MVFRPPGFEGLAQGGLEHLGDEFGMSSDEGLNRRIQPNHSAGQVSLKESD
ncbi:MAG: hypothetical protein RLZZ356_1838 [Verrucomicrobiota bacterium]|jgi:hypothetical protein